MTLRSVSHPLAIVALASALGCARHRDPEPAPVPAASRVDPAPAGQSGSASGDPARTPMEYRGAYTAGFEMSWFEPCGAPRNDAMWWVTLTDEALHQRDSILATIKAQPTNGLAVRWRGTISMRMPSAGHGGRGTRYMLVTSIQEMRPLPPGGACTDRIG